MSATNRGAKRRKADFYPTPLSAFLPLLPYLDRELVHHDPACGDNRLVDCLRENKFMASGDDLAYGADFLEFDSYKPCILTNPPFSLAEEFITVARAHSKECFMLLRLNFLGGQKRKAFWKLNKPDALFVLSERPSFTGDGKTDACEYAWFYWGKRHKGIFHI